MKYLGGGGGCNRNMRGIVVGEAFKSGICSQPSSKKILHRVNPLASLKLNVIPFFNA